LGFNLTPTLSGCRIYDCIRVRDLKHCNVGNFTVCLLVISTILLATSCGTTPTNRFAIKVAKAKLWNEAAFRWQQVIDQEPKAAFAYNNLGVAYEAGGKIEQALTAYQQAVEIEPENKHYRYNYRRCRSIQKNRSNQALEDLDQTQAEETDSIGETQE